MIELPGGSIFLQKGEQIPCHCECGKYIQTTAARFNCPACGAEIVAEENREQVSYRFTPNN